MNEPSFLLVVGLALIPAAANALGGVTAEVLPVSSRALSLVLHTAAGIVIGVVGLELAAEAFAANPAWLPIAAFVLGGGVFLLLDHLIGHIRDRFGGGEQSSGPWAIYMGVSMDLLSDGVLIGTGTVIDPGLGLLLALGQAPADFPEGLAAVATLKGVGVPRTQRVGLAFAFAIPILIGATVGFWALRGAPELAQAAVLATTGGVLLAVVVEEMVTQAHEGAEPSYSALALVGGFALFALISVYLG